MAFNQMIHYLHNGSMLNRNVYRINRLNHYVNDEPFYEMSLFLPF